MVDIFVCDVDFTVAIGACVVIASRNMDKRQHGVERKGLLDEFARNNKSGSLWLLECSWNKIQMHETEKIQIKISKNSRE